MRRRPAATSPATTGATGNIELARKEFAQAEQLYQRSSHPERAKGMAEERVNLDKRPRPWLAAGLVVGAVVAFLILITLVVAALQ